MGNEKGTSHGDVPLIVRWPGICIEQAPEPRSTRLPVVLLARPTS